MSESTTPKPSRWLVWLPLALFTGFALLGWTMLRQPAAREVHSALVGKPLPEFSLKPALPGQPGLMQSDFVGGKPRLLNVFASWCIPCAVEAPQLAQLREAGIEIHGVAIRDTSEDVAAFLQRHGNPFARIGADEVSAIQFALGSSGVPESFVIDAKGTIRYQHIGEIRPEHVPLILEKLHEAER